MDISTIIRDVEKDKDNQYEFIYSMFQHNLEHARHVENAIVQYISVFTAMIALVMGFISASGDVSANMRGFICAKWRYSRFFPFLLIEDGQAYLKRKEPMHKLVIPRCIKCAF